MLSSLPPLSNLRELDLPYDFNHPWTAASLSTVSACFTSLTSITLGHIADLTSLALLLQLKQLQQIELKDRVEVSLLRLVSGLPISSLRVSCAVSEVGELIRWLNTGAATKLHAIELRVHGVAGVQDVVQSLAPLPQLRRFNVEVPCSRYTPEVQQHASSLQPLSSSSSLTALELRAVWDAPINVAYLPSKLVELTVLVGGLGNWGPSEELASRLGRLTYLQVGCVTGADAHKLAMLPGLQSLSVGRREGGEAFSAASLQGLSILSHLTQLQLLSRSARQCAVDFLPVLSSLSRLKSLGVLGCRGSDRWVSLPTAVSIITSSPHLATLEVSVQELRSYSCYGSSVKSVSRPRVDVLIRMG